MHLPTNLVLPTDRVGYYDETITLRQMEDSHRMSVAFLRFHRENPHVLRAFHRLCWSYLDRVNPAKVSTNHVCEVLRWEEHIRTQSDTFTISNNHRAFYGRVLDRNDAGLTGRISMHRGSSLADIAEWKTLTPADVDVILERNEK